MTHTCNKLPHYRSDIFFIYRKKCVDEWCLHFLYSSANANEEFMGIHIFLVKEWNLLTREITLRIKQLVCTASCTAK